MTTCCNHHQGKEEVVQINVYGATLSGMLTKGINIPHILSTFGYGDCIVFDVPRRENPGNHPITNIHNNSSLNESQLSQVSRGLFSGASAPRREVQIASSSGVAAISTRSSQPYRDTSRNILLDCSLSTIASCNSSIHGDEEEEPAARDVGHYYEFVEEPMVYVPRSQRGPIVYKPNMRFIDMSDSRLYTDDISFTSSVVGCVISLLEDVCQEADATVVQQNSPVKEGGDRGRKEGEKELERMEDVEMGEPQDNEVPPEREEMEAQEAATSVQDNECLTTMAILEQVSALLSPPAAVEDVKESFSNLSVEPAPPSVVYDEEKTSEFPDDVVVKTSDSSQDVTPETPMPQLEDTVYYDEGEEPPKPLSGLEILSQCLRDVDTGVVFFGEENVDVEAVGVAQPIDGLKDPAWILVEEGQRENEVQEEEYFEYREPLIFIDGFPDLYEEPAELSYEETNQNNANEDGDLLLADAMDASDELDGNQEAIEREEEPVEESQEHMPQDEAVVDPVDPVSVFAEGSGMDQDPPIYHHQVDSHDENMLMRDAAETSSGFMEKENFEKSGEQIRHQEFHPDSKDHPSVPADLFSYKLPKNESNESLALSTKSSDRKEDHLPSQQKNLAESLDMITKEDVADQVNRSRLLENEEAENVAEEWNPLRGGLGGPEMMEAAPNPQGYGEHDEFFDCSQGEYEMEDDGGIQNDSTKIEQQKGVFDDFGGGQASESFLEPSVDTNEALLPASINKAHLSNKNTGEHEMEAYGDVQKEGIRVEQDTFDDDFGEGEAYESFMEPAVDTKEDLPTTSKACLSMKNMGAGDMNLERGEKEEHKAKCDRLSAGFGRDVASGSGMLQNSAPEFSNAVLAVPIQKARLSKNNMGGGSTYDRGMEGQKVKRGRVSVDFGNDVASGSGLHQLLAPDFHNAVLPVPVKRARLSRKDTGGDDENNQNSFKNEETVEDEADAGEHNAHPAANKKPRFSMKNIEGRMFACSFANCNTRIQWKQSYGRVRFLDHVKTHYNRPLLKCALCDHRDMYEAKFRYHHKKCHDTVQWVKPIDVSETADKEGINQLWEVCFPGLRKKRVSTTNRHDL